VVKKARINLVMASKDPGKEHPLLLRLPKVKVDIKKHIFKICFILEGLRRKS